MWQDILIMCGGFILATSLLPTVLSKDKPPIATALPLCLVLGAYAVAFATLGFWLSMTTMTLQSILWGIVTIQKWRKHA